MYVQTWDRTWCQLNTKNQNLRQRTFYLCKEWNRSNYYNRISCTYEIEEIIIVTSIRLSICINYSLTLFSLALQSLRIWSSISKHFCGVGKVSRWSFNNVSGNYSGSSLGEVHTIPTHVVQWTTAPFGCWITAHNGKAKVIWSLPAATCHHSRLNPCSTANHWKLSRNYQKSFTHGGWRLTKLFWRFINRHQVVV